MSFVTTMVNAQARPETNPHWKHPITIRVLLPEDNNPKGTRTTRHNGEALEGSLEVLADDQMPFTICVRFEGKVRASPPSYRQHS